MHPTRTTRCSSMCSRRLVLAFALVAVESSSNTAGSDADLQGCPTANEWTVLRAHARRRNPAAIDQHTDAKAVIVIKERMLEHACVVQGQLPLFHYQLHEDYAAVGLDGKAGHQRRLAEAAWWRLPRNEGSLEMQAEIHSWLHQRMRKFSNTDYDPFAFMWEEEEDVDGEDSEAEEDPFSPVGHIQDLIARGADPFLVFADEWGFPSNAVNMAELVGDEPLVKALFHDKKDTARCAHLRPPWVQNLRYFEHTGVGGRQRLRDFCESYLRTKGEDTAWRKAIGQYLGKSAGNGTALARIGAMQAHTCDNRVLLQATGKHKARITGIILDELGACGVDTAAYIDWQDERRGNRTALHMAAYDGNDALVELLLARGADPDVVDSTHATALHIAVSGSFANATAMLASAGSDLLIKDMFGRTATDIAVLARSRLDLTVLAPSLAADAACASAVEDTPLREAPTTQNAAPLHAKWPGTKHEVPAALLSDLPVSECDFDVLYAWRAPANQFVRYLTARQPVLIRGGATGYDGFTRWTPEYLTRKYADRLFEVADIPYADTFGGKGGSQMNLTDYIIAMGHGREYLFASDKDQVNLLKDVQADFKRHPWFVQKKLTATTVQLAIGPAGAGAPFHHHKNALNSLFVGSKLWLMYPPGEAFVSNQHTLDFIKEHVAGLGSGTKNPPAGPKDAPDQPHLRSLLRRKPPIKCIQRAGDILFVPDGFAHATVNLETAVGVAVEYEPADVHKLTQDDPRQGTWDVFVETMQRLATSDPWTPRKDPNGPNAAERRQTTDELHFSADTTTAGNT